jgi:hypothetical protein
MRESVTDEVSIEVKGKQLSQYSNSTEKTLLLFLSEPSALFMLQGSLSKIMIRTKGNALNHRTLIALSRPLPFSNFQNDTMISSK